jgi:plastocyanin
MRGARRWVRWVGVFGGLLLLAGCGSGTAALSSASPGPYTIDIAGQAANYEGTLDLRTTGDNDVEISMQETSYSPTVVQAVRGTRVAITLVNEDPRVAHTFTIPGAVDVELAPDERRTISVLTPIEAGLTFSCRFYADAGMRGALNDPMPPGEGDPLAPPGAADSVG